MFGNLLNKKGPITAVIATVYWTKFSFSLIVWLHTSPFPNAKFIDNEISDWNF